MRLYEICRHPDIIIEYVTDVNTDELTRYAEGYFSDLIEDMDFRNDISNLVKKKIDPIIGKEFDSEGKDFIISRIQEWILSALDLW